MRPNWPEVAVFDEEHIDFARVRQNLKFMGVAREGDPWAHPRSTEKVQGQSHTSRNIVKQKAFDGFWLFKQTFVSIGIEKN